MQWYSRHNVLNPSLEMMPEMTWAVNAEGVMILTSLQFTAFSLAP
jgi:hypothetical protein